MSQGVMRRAVRKALPALRPLMRSGPAVRALKQIKGVSFIAYHEVTDAALTELPAGLVTSVRRFSQELAWLAEHFEIIPIGEAFRRIERGTFSAHAVVLCFDDGYRGVADHVYPILVKRRVPATLFLNSAFYAGTDVGLRLKLELILRRYPWEQIQRSFPMVRDAGSFVALAKQGLPAQQRRSIEALARGAGASTLSAYYLHEADVAAMSPELITVANHTRAHQWLPGLSAQEQEEEILESHRALAALPHFRAYLAIPFGTPGSFDRTTLALVARHYRGYFLTAYGGINTRGKRDGAVTNVVRNAVSETRPALPELLWTNYVTMTLLG